MPRIERWALRHMMDAQGHKWILTPLTARQRFAAQSYPDAADERGGRWLGGLVRSQPTGVCMFGCGCEVGFEGRENDVNKVLGFVFWSF